MLAPRRADCEFLVYELVNLNSNRKCICNDFFEFLMNSVEYLTNSLSLMTFCKFLIKLFEFLKRFFKICSMTVCKSL